jgi:hypothetical protein
VQCFTLDGTNKKRGIFGSGKAQTAAIPGGTARIGNTARAEKTLFYAPDNVKHCTGFNACCCRTKIPPKDSRPENLFPISQGGTWKIVHTAAHPSPPHAPTSRPS